jgi:transposase-like protein
MIDGRMILLDRREKMRCTICQKDESVIKHGINRGGTQRYRCLACRKTFTPSPTLRGTDTQTVEAIQKALEEKMAFNAIKKNFKVGWATIKKIAEKQIE